MAFTQQDLDNVNAAIVSGERQVVIGGESVLYNTTESMIKARSLILNDLATQAAKDAGRRINRRSLLQYTGRGYNDGGC
jgi:hypothetical protein